MKRNQINTACARIVIASGLKENKSCSREDLIGQMEEGELTEDLHDKQSLDPTKFFLNATPVTRCEGRVGLLI